MRLSFLGFFTFLIANVFAQEIDRSNNQLLWKISGNGIENPAYLYGSYHSNDKDIFVFPDSVLWALDQAERVILETSITSMMDMVDVREKPKEYVFNKKGKLKKNKNYDPNTQTTGYGSDKGNPQFIDLYFQQVSETCNKEFKALEKLSDQMALAYSRVSDKATAEDKAASRSISQEDLKKAYLKGDIEELHDLTKTSIRIFDGYYQKLIVDRNIIMANGLDTLVRDKKVFCAVGAAHLGGANGIIPLLREKGFTLTPVKAIYTDKLKSYFEKFKKCDGYYYRNDLYDFSMNFPGKPAETVQDNNAVELFYQEMGQGNFYGVYAEHGELADNRQYILDNYFFVDGEYKNFDEWDLDAKTKVIQGRVKHNGDDTWYRIYLKNNVNYVLYCYGGESFMNSNRPMKYFEKLDLLDTEIELSEFDFIQSPSNTLKAYLPKTAVTFEQQRGYDRYWSGKWFHPNTNESFFAYEFQTLENSVQLTFDFFGEYLFNDYHKDSIIRTDSIITPNYLQFNYTATSDKGNATGWIRKAGNMIYFCEYTGDNEQNKNLFLDSTKIEMFTAVPEFKWVKKSQFHTKVSKSGFKREKVSKDINYFRKKKYFVNDIKHGISYFFNETKYEDFTFFTDTPKIKLTQALNLPKDSTLYTLKTTFDLNDTIPSVKYRLDFVESKNTLFGKALFTGNRLLTFELLTLAANAENYKNSYFIDSTKITNLKPTKLFKVDGFGLNRALKGSDKEYEKAQKFIQNENISPAVAKVLLTEIDSLYRDTKESFASPAYRLINKLENKDLNDEVFKLYLSSLPYNADFQNSILLERFAFKDANYFTEVIKQTIDKPIVVYFTDSILQRKDIIEPQLSLVIDYLKQKRIYTYGLLNFFSENYKKQEVATYLRSKDFAVLARYNSAWLYDDYLKILRKYNNKKYYKKGFKKWKLSEKNNYYVGEYLAFKLDLKKRLKRKEKNSLENSINAKRGFYRQISDLDSTLITPYFNYNDYLSIVATGYDDEFYFEVAEIEDKLKDGNDVYNIIRYYTSEKREKINSYLLVVKLPATEVYDIHLIEKNCRYLNTTENPTLQNLKNLYKDAL